MPAYWPGGVPPRPRPLAEQPQRHVLRARPPDRSGRCSRRSHEGPCATGSLTFTRHHQHPLAGLRRHVLPVPAPRDRWYRTRRVHPRGGPVPGPPGSYRLAACSPATALSASSAGKHSDADSISTTGCQPCSAMLSHPSWPLPIQPSPGRPRDATWNRRQAPSRDHRMQLGSRPPVYS